jgi:asparagine synthase (glutamine-hydrolysing)
MVRRMCGIAGIWTARGEAADVLAEIGHAMSATLRHRGPDDSGTWVDSRAGIVLASRRLAIQDLSPAGHMPMVSHCGRFVIVYNGEVYNFRDIRAELQKKNVPFSGSSDTEVLVNACASWGIEATLKRLNGMFSFALWDKLEQTLTLVRDRLGIKPLYYGWCDGVLLFASELKAFHRYPAFPKRIDRRSVALFVRLGYIPAPHSIYDSVYKLPPGHFVQIKSGCERSSPTPFWRLTALPRKSSRECTHHLNQTTEELDQLLRDAIRLRMLADVPVGAFLSGGIDSSVVVAMMQAQTTAKVKTFTIGFDQSSHDEAEHSRAVAAYLHTDHTVLRVSADTALEMIPRLPAIYDEPFADPSQIPTFLVSRLAREAVTVSLSGDGGDELFGGYAEYVRGGRRLALLRALSPLRWLSRSAARALTPLAPDRVAKLATLADIRSPEALHHYHVSQWISPSDVLFEHAEHPTPFTEHTVWPDGINDVEKMMYLDLVTYLPEDILTKVDRASMAVGLEARVPLLDYRVVEFAWQLPLELKLFRRQGKRILRAILARYLPPRLTERPKMGFDCPLATWLRGPLKPWAEDLLAPSQLRNADFLNVERITAIWRDHVSNRRNFASRLWHILMFEAWRAEWC